MADDRRERGQARPLLGCVVVAARTVTRPYSLTRQLSYDEAQGIAARILADSYTSVPRDDLEAFATWAQEIERAPLEELATARQALTVTYQRLDDERSEVSELRRELHSIRNSTQVHILRGDAAERKLARRDAELAEARRSLAEIDDTVVIEMFGAA